MAPEARTSRLSEAPAQPDAPFDMQRRMKAVAAMREIGREIARRGGPITREEIALWIREGRDEAEAQLGPVAGPGKPA